jgi:hypothetical protein
MKPRIRILNETEAAAAAMASRIVAIRWDIVPWSLVLDLDAPAAEGTQMRLWLVFWGLSEVTWPFERARIPNGVWTSGPIGIGESNGDFTDYHLAVLLPAHDENDRVVGRPTREGIIRSQGMRGFSSAAAVIAGEFNSLSRSQRLALATDDELETAALEAEGKAVV